MGKRSKMPETDEEIEALSDEALDAELARVRVQLGWLRGLAHKATLKRLYWLEKHRARRDLDA